MRIFISDVREMLAAGADKSILARKLLAYGVEKLWGCAMPAISKDEKGKPYFAGHEDMHFSLSHTKTHVLAAVSKHPVGADIETIRPVKEAYKRLFSGEMYSAFGYFGGWTLREAVFKLRGEGALRSMDIRLENGEIVTPFEGVKCALYEGEDYAFAAASYGGDFPEGAEQVAPERFLCKDYGAGA